MSIRIRIDFLIQSFDDLNLADLLPLFAREEEVAGVQLDLVQRLLPSAERVSNPVKLKNIGTVLTNCIGTVRYRPER